MSTWNTAMLNASLSGRRTGQLGNKSGRGAVHRGVTLMETIFAIGVILVGLLGLAALIPIAADNAKATLEMDQSISESTSVAAAGVARDIVSLDSLVIYDNPAAGSPILPIFTNPTFSYAPSRQPQTVRWKLETQSNYNRPVLATVPTPQIVYGKLESPGYGHHPLSSGLTAGICIDPFGMPAPWLIGASAGAVFPNPNPGPSSAFDYSRFPYYSERYNPLQPPNSAIPSATLPPMPAWPMSPRMWRATLVSPLSDNGVAPVFPREMLPQGTMQRIFTGLANVERLAGPQSDDPGGVLINRTQIGAGLVDAGRNHSSEYTWFVTLSPPIEGGNTFRQSIVVVRQRVPAVPQQANDTRGLNGQVHVVSEPEDNPPGERLTWIGQAIGFTGGTGGEVLMYGSQSVINEIKPDEWVMLSSQPHDVETTNSAYVGPVGPAVHRWFRVLGVDDPEVGLANSTFEPNWIDASSPPVWRRWVTLAGPDWEFGLSDNQPPSAAITPTLANDTFCTIVQGAVSVYQSEVQLN